MNFNFNTNIGQQIPAGVAAANAIYFPAVTDHMRQFAADNGITATRLMHAVREAVAASRVLEVHQLNAAGIQLEEALSIAKAMPDTIASVMVSPMVSGRSARAERLSKLVAWRDANGIALTDQQLKDAMIP